MTWALARPLMREASFNQGDVVPVMGAVFDHLPVSPDDLRYLSLGALGAGQAGDLVAVFLLLLGSPCLCADSGGLAKRR